MNAPWHIQLLGDLRARQGERVVTRFRTQSTGALLAYLAYHKGHSHPREVLVERFWPEVPPDKGRHNLSNALSSLRNQLEPPGGVPPGSVLIADRLSVELNPAAFTTDVEAFEQTLRQAAQAKGSTPAAIAERMEHLARAVEIYGGPLLPGYYDAWITAEQERLAGRFLDAVLQLVRLHEQQGESDTALEYARRAIAADPTSEEAHREVIRLLLVARRDPAAALRQYRELERRLRDDLGEEPAPATRQLLRQIEQAAEQEQSRQVTHHRLLRSRLRFPLPRKRPHRRRHLAKRAGSLPAARSRSC
jgi:DNA-binding SARP family transcriptional activator